ncbi:MAG: sugar phosphate isomerase/epimerase [Peptostreptococcaceae bacterium]|nr:sugar phosphate isomerase/epimerase [Peptostreptococcaceae bacterium]
MNIRNRLYIATYATNSLDVIKSNGLGMESNHVCMTEYLNSDKIEDTYNGIVEDIERCGCADKLILHAPFTEIIPMGIDQRIVMLGMERLNEAAELAVRLGTKKMVVHTGLITDMYFDEWHIEKSSIFWSKFIENKPKDFKLVIENVFENSPKALKEIIDNINDPRVGICLDVGHANAVEKEYSAEDWISYLGNRINHFHIHNNNGERKDTHSPIGLGTIDYKSIFKSIEKNCNDEVTFTIESMNCEDSIKWLIEEKYI